MDWIKKFYSTTGTWWGPAEVKVTERDHERLNILKRIHGSQPETVLELGSSYGNAASVMAEAGIHVTAIEISDRADFAKQYSNKKYPGSLKILKEDFYKVQLPIKFDAICYWNGFGIGSDEDQRSFYENRKISESMSAKIDEQVQKITDAAYKQAVAVLKKLSKQLDLLAEELLKRETIEGEDFEKLIGPKKLLPGSKPALLQVEA